MLYRSAACAASDLIRPAAPRGQGQLLTVLRRPCGTTISHTMPSSTRNLCSVSQIGAELLRIAPRVRCRTACVARSRSEPSSRCPRSQAPITRFANLPDQAACPILPCLGAGDSR